MAAFTVSDAVSIHDVMGAVFSKRNVRWMDTDGTVRTGAIRSLVAPNGASVPADMDVRDAHIHVTSGVVETTIPIAYAMQLIRNGGIVFE